MNRPQTIAIDPDFACEGFLVTIGPDRCFRVQIRAVESGVGFVCNHRFTSYVLAVSRGRNVRGRGVIIPSHWRTIASEDLTKAIDADRRFRTDTSPPHYENLIRLAHQTNGDCNDCVANTSRA